jgi:hypothetical protein
VTKSVISNYSGNKVSFAIVLVSKIVANDTFNYLKQVAKWVLLLVNLFMYLNPIKFFESNSNEYEFEINRIQIT